MKRLDNGLSHKWHCAINKHTEQYMGTSDWPGWMYAAKEVADEIPRMVLLFKSERTDQLPSTHKQCSHSESVEVEDNHLSCCKGVKCKECEHLIALEAAELSPDEIDTIKAWTCASHILSTGGDVAGEGYLLRVDDRIFWDNLYRNELLTD